MRVSKLYGRISGLNINTDKTKVIWFGACKTSQQIICSEYDLSWENNIFTVPGVKFSTNLNEIVDINYQTKIESIDTWNPQSSTREDQCFTIYVLHISIEGVNWQSQKGYNNPRGQI